MIRQKIIVLYYYCFHLQQKIICNRALFDHILIFCQCIYIHENSYHIENVLLEMKNTKNYYHLFDDILHTEQNNQQEEKIMIWMRVHSKVSRYILSLYYFYFTDRFS
jgi:hypothetical protein